MNAIGEIEIPPELQEHINKHYDSSIPKKQGVIILRNGQRIPWATDNYNEVPICERCNIAMLETTYGDASFGWWCPGPECQKELSGNVKKQKNTEIINTIEKTPEQILPKYGIGKKYFECTLDNFKGYHNIIDSCRRYIEKPDRSLFFTGNPGTGKTHLACAILRELIKGSYTDLYFKSIPEFLLDIRRTYDAGNKDLSDADIIDRYALYDFLILDDLGSEKQTDFSRTSLYTLIDKRMREMKTTIVTSNFSIEQIESNISQRIGSRLAEYKVVKFDMQDYRKVR